MSFKHGARIKHTSVTTGTGTLTLIAPAAANLQSYNAVFGAGPVKVLYVIQGTTYFEIGIGTFTNAGPTLSRDTVLMSSAGGSPVSLPAATHDVFAYDLALWPVDARTGSPTLTLADLFGFILYIGAGGTVGLPAIAGVPAGVGFPFLNLGSGAASLDPNGAELINGLSALSVGVNQGGWIFTRDSAWCMIMGVAANPAALDVAQTFTQPQTISGAGLTPLTLTSTDAGAAEGPIEDLYRDSSSPAASDLIGARFFSGRSSTAVKRQYAKIGAQILDPTNASEDAELFLQTIVAGTLASRLIVGAGVRVGSPTGGDPGAGILNATGLQINGAAIGARELDAWVNFQGTGTVTILADDGVSTVGDNGGGDYTVNWDTAQGSANYSFVGTANQVALANMSSNYIQLRNTDGSGMTTGAVRINSGNTGTGSPGDCSRNFVHAVG